MRLLPLILLTLIVSLPAFARDAHPGRPGVFDYYLLTLSWEPEFCHAPRNAQSEECRNATHGFVLHGLWPQYAEGYPEHCTDARGPQDASQLLDIMPTARLAQHEWATHGTCSGLVPDDYFKVMRGAFHALTIPQMLAAPRHGFSMTPAQIKQAFAEANPGLRENEMTVGCGNNYLTAVSICLNKDDLKPAACGHLRDCRAHTVRVTPVP